MNTPFAIETSGLKKSFGSLEAVRGLDLRVAKGEIFSLLGPNGAGKSTTISMICGLLQPSAGQVSVCGFDLSRDPKAAKAALGVVPQDIALYPDLSAKENLLFWGRMYGLAGNLLRQRVAETLEMIGLTDRQNGRIGSFSGGMKRRVNIGVALLHRPQVVIMDEPTVGIDPQSRRHILDNVKELNRQGMTVLYTTHYMEEAQELSDHIAIMDHGQMIASGTHSELLHLVGEHTRVDLTVTADPAALAKAWRNIEGVAQVTPNHQVVRLMVTDSNRVLPRVFESAAALGARVQAVDIQEANLESVFLHLTGRALRDSES
ncbi:MAG: ABC transporter ATP-binding protein [Chloroflexi bacterium]|nr:ABC transporter ATP-binding protein [Chloroflexota bacterium]